MITTTTNHASDHEVSIEFSNGYQAIVSAFGTGQNAEAIALFHHWNPLDFETE